MKELYEEYLEMSKNYFKQPDEIAKKNNCEAYYTITAENQNILDDLEKYLVDNNRGYCINEDGILEVTTDSFQFICENYKILDLLNIELSFKKLQK